MMIKVTCPRCSAELEYGDLAQGRTVNCPECNRSFIVTGSPVEEPPDLTEPTHSNPIALQSALLISGGVVFILMTMAAIIGLIRLHNNPKPAQEALGRAGGILGESVASVSGLLIAILVVVLVVGYCVLAIGVTAWVARDAHNRRHNALGWAMFYLGWQVAGSAVALPLIPFCGLGLIVLPFAWIGLLIYLGGRSQGQLEVCPICSNKKLLHARNCPHCGSGISA